MSTEPPLLRRETLPKVLRRRRRNVSVVLTAAMTDHSNACLRDFSWSLWFLCVAVERQKKQNKTKCVYRLCLRCDATVLSLKFTYYFGWHHLPNYLFSKCNVYSEQNLYFYPAWSLPGKARQPSRFGCLCVNTCVSVSAAYSAAPAELLHARGGAGVQSQCHVPARCSSGQPGPGGSDSLPQRQWDAVPSASICPQESGLRRRSSEVHQWRQCRLVDNCLAASPLWILSTVRFHVLSARSFKPIHHWRPSGLLMQA